MIVELIYLISFKKEKEKKIVSTIIYTRKYVWHYATFFTFENWKPAAMTFDGLVHTSLSYSA